MGGVGGREKGKGMECRRDAWRWWRQSWCHGGDEYGYDETRTRVRMMRFSYMHMCISRVIVSCTSHVFVAPQLLM